MSPWSGTPSVADDEHTLTQAQQRPGEPVGSDAIHGPGSAACPLACEVPLSSRVQ